LKKFKRRAISMPRNNIYYVYDQGVLIDKGTSEELAYKYHVSKRGIPNYANRGYKLLGLYDIRLSGLHKAFEKKEKPKPMSAYEKTLDYLYRHLVKYGNTVLNEEDDPLHYIPMLEEELKKKIYTRRVAEKLDPFNYEADEFNEGKFKRGKTKYFYVLEAL
jgi:hypothetical protein